MATNAELTSLYGDLRATLLSRHFAVGRHFRANYLSLFNELGLTRNPRSSAPPDRDDVELGCDAERSRPTTYGSGPPTFDSANDLLSKSPDVQVVERWRINNHNRENALYFSGQVLVCLAVEHHLGRTTVEPIIKEALRSIGSMYKFSGAFAGYPIRWDAVTSDRWATQKVEGRPEPRYCCDFLLSPDRTSYLYCTPFQDPRYTPYMREEEFRRLTTDDKRAYIKARMKSLDVYRRWEPSMDELVGLICGYDVVFRLVDDADIREEVRRQVDDLGEYLAANGYLLVRPSGGFTARGAADVLPVFEFPWQRVFERITGNPHKPRVGFEGALAKAGVWASLEGPMRTATIASVAASIVVPAILALVTGGVLGILFAVLGPLLGFTLGVVAARTLVLWGHRECFDVYSWPGDGSAEFPGAHSSQDSFFQAYLWKKAPQDVRFRVWFGGVEDHGNGPASQFPPWLGLTGLDDSDDTVRRMFLKFLPERRKHPDLDDGTEDINKYATNPFASAVAVLLGAGEEEEKNLVRLLDEWRHTIDSSMNRDFALTGKDLVDESYRPALSYMAALALAWLHAKRRADAGAPIPTWIGFPTPPSLNDHFPLPAVPQQVLSALGNGTLSLPSDTWGFRKDHPADGGLFGSQAAPPKQDDAPTPILKPSADKDLVTDVTVAVTEADLIVDTFVDLHTEDEYVIDASGSIWAGVWGTGDNGPNGWATIDNDLKFPLHGPPDGHPFALIGRLGGGGYFFVGTRFPRTAPERMLNLEPGMVRLLLRTNDDSPGNGSRREKDKLFTCRVRVWR
jgi:hypothetical protein